MNRAWLEHLVIKLSRHRQQLIRSARAAETQHLRSLPLPAIDLDRFPDPPHVPNHVWTEDSRPARRRNTGEPLGFVEKIESTD